MLIVADKKIPEQARERLAAFGELLLLETQGITYEAISGHPDIFFCRINDQWVVAPNLPDEFKKILEEKNIPFVPGGQPVGDAYPDTAKYNAVGTDKYLFHNLHYTDSVIFSEAAHHKRIHLRQGYCRCNLIPLKNDRFITSDKGIFAALTNQKLEVLYVNPEGIRLPGFKHGFIGGSAGILDDNIIFTGKLDHFPDGNKIKQFLSYSPHQIIELYDGPLFDGGSLLFMTGGLEGMES